MARVASDPHFQAVSTPVRHWFGMRRRTGEDVREDYDGEFEPFRAVHRHDPRDVVRLFGSPRFGGLGRVLPFAEPAREGAQATGAARGEGARLVRQFDEVRRGLPAVPARQGKLYEAGSREHFTNELTQRDTRSQP